MTSRGRTKYRHSATYDVLLSAVESSERVGDRIPCMRNDPELWFANDERSERAAKSLCRSCPAVLPCLQHAIAGQEVGVWGATTARERDSRNLPGRSI